MPKVNSAIKAKPNVLRSFVEKLLINEKQNLQRVGNENNKKQKQVIETKDKIKQNKLIVHENVLNIDNFKTSRKGAM